jgi:hypothetical protein
MARVPELAFFESRQEQTPSRARCDWYFERLRCFRWLPADSVRFHAITSPFPVGRNVSPGFQFPFKQWQKPFGHDESGGFSKRYCRRLVAAPFPSDELFLGFSRGRVAGGKMRVQIVRLSPPVF